MNMYSVYDRVAQKFMGMFESINDGTASRAFCAACKTGQMAQEPEDYMLYKIGEFDEDKGTFSNTQRKVCDGKPNNTSKGGN